MFVSFTITCFLRHSWYSPEPETLDRLSGGDLPLITLRSLYPDDEAFVQGISGLSSSVEVRLLTLEKSDVTWRWREIFSPAVALPEIKDYCLSINSARRTENLLK